MRSGLSETIETDESIDAKPETSSPTLGVIALRFITLLAAIDTVFTWAWSR